MKRLLFNILLLGFALTLVSCKSSNTDANNNEAETTTTTESDATNTEEVSLVAETTHFRFLLGTTKEVMKSEISKKVRTNGTLYFSNLPSSVGTKNVTLTATKDGKSKTLSITIEVYAPEELSFSISKSSFEFTSGVTASQIETEIKKYVTTNGTIAFSSFNTAVGTQTVYVYAELGNKSMGETVTIKINEVSSELSFSISKSSFEFTSGVTASQIETEIKKYVTTNGTIAFSTFNTAVGTQAVYVYATLGNKSMGETVTVKINEVSSELSFSISKSSFEFTSGVTASQIETEIKKYVTTNGTIAFSSFNTAVGSQNVYVYATLGNKSMGETVTVKINEVSPELSFSISKSSFEFTSGVTASQIETEIKKYVTTNGTIAFSTFNTAVGTQTVYVYATLGNKSMGETVTVKILEGPSISMSKTSFEFNYGYTLDELKEEIEKYITANGTILFSGLGTDPGTYNCRALAVKNNGSVYKDFTVTILDTLSFKFTEENLEFLYGTTFGEIKTAINNCIETNGTITYPDIDSSTVYSCNSYFVKVTSTYKGVSETKEFHFAIKPDSSKIKLASFSDYPVNMSCTSSTLSYSLAFTNNSGRQIKKMNIYVFIYVGDNVKAVSKYTYDATTASYTYKQGETSSVRYTQSYSENFFTFSYSNKPAEYYYGYDYNFWKSYKSTYTVSVFFTDVEFY